MGDAHTRAAAEHGLKLPYEDAVSRGTVDLQSLGIFIHTDAQEMCASKAAEHGLRLPYEKAVSRDTMRV